MSRFTDRIIDALIRRAKQTPYSHIGGYMERFWLVPFRDKGAGPGCGPVSFWRRPFAWVLQRLGIAVRLHHILRSDDARAFHDHPWAFVSVILRGSYTEVRPIFEHHIYRGNRWQHYGPGAVLFRRASAWHRIVLGFRGSVWTLFISGPWAQQWGFLVEARYKMPWREYVANRGQEAQK